MNNFIKKIILVSCLTLLLSGCGKTVEKEKDDTKIQDSSVKTSANEFNTPIDKQYSNILNRYFNYNSIRADNYESLARYPVAYTDVLIQFYAYVDRVIEENGDKYKILVNFVNNNLSSDTSQQIVIEGTYVEGKRYMANDFLKIYGIYKGMNTYSINNVDTVLPKVITDKIIMDESEGLAMFVEYDETEIRKVADAFFESSYTIIKPSYQYGSQNFDYLMSLPFHYIIKLDNQSNAKFNQYRIYTSFGGGISVATEDETSDIKRYINKSDINGNFILSTYTEHSKYLEIEYYDKNFKRLWNRTFENVENYIYDMNNGKIILNINSSIYSVDEKTGKDVYTPILVGEGIRIAALSNGDCILITKKKSDYMLYVDSKGTIKFKNGITYEIQSSDIQLANEKIYINNYLSDTKKNNVMVYDLDGKLLIDTAK